MEIWRQSESIGTKNTSVFLMEVTVLAGFYAVSSVGHPANKLSVNI